MAKAKRARRNSFRTMTGEGALDALEALEQIEQAGKDDDATPAPPTDDEQPPPTADKADKA